MLLAAPTLKILPPLLPVAVGESTNGHTTVSDHGSTGHADRALHGLRWVGSARVFTQIVSWGLTALTVRLLQPRDYGLIATAGLFTAFATLLLDGGLTVVLISRRDLPLRVPGAAVTAVLLASTVLGLVILAVAPAGSVFFRSPPLATILEVSALYMPLAALAVVPLAVLSREMHFRQIALVQTASSVLQGVCSLAFAYSGAGYWALIIGNFAGTALRVSLLWKSLKTPLVPNLHLRDLRPLLRNSSHVIGQRLAYFATGDFDIFVLGRFAGPVAVGPYSLAKSLAHSPLDQLSGVVSQVSVPAFAAKADLRAQADGLVALVSLAATLMFPLYWLMGVLAPVGLPLVFGPRWEQLIVPFCAFALILPLRSIYALLESSIVGTGKTGTTLNNMLTWAAVMTPLLFVLARNGTTAAALAWIIGFPIVFLVAMLRVARAFATRISVFLRPLAVPAGCSAVSCAAAEVVSQIAAPHAARPVVLVGQAIVGTTCYWLLIRQYGRSQYDRMLYLARRLISR